MGAARLAIAPLGVGNLLLADFGSFRSLLLRRRIVSRPGGLSGALIVTTPQDVALIDAIKGVRMFQNEHVGVPVLGIVENMSSFICPHCGEESEIFPRGELHQELERLGVPILARIPIDPAVANGSDSGRPIVLAAPDSPAAVALRGLAQAVRARVPQTAGG